MQNETTFSASSDTGRDGEPVRWESANTVIEAQTRAIAREFKTSKPRPRNRAMGFRGDDRQKLSHSL